MTDDKTPSPSPKDQLAHRSGLSWIVTRLLPVTIGALFFGVVVGWLRHGTTSMRARLSEDGSELTIAGRPRLRDGSQVDAVVTATR